MTVAIGARETLNASPSMFLQASARSLSSMLDQNRPSKRIGGGAKPTMAGVSGVGCVRGFTCRPLKFARHTLPHLVGNGRAGSQELWPDDARAPERNLLGRTRGAARRCQAPQGGHPEELGSEPEEPLELRRPG